MPTLYEVITRKPGAEQGNEHQWRNKAKQMGALELVLVEDGMSEAGHILYPVYIMPESPMPLMGPHQVVKSIIPIAHPNVPLRHIAGPSIPAG